MVYVAGVATAVGQQLGKNDFSLVSGSGLTVGSASISGFLTALQEGGIWDLDRRLIARPFPQPLEGQVPNREQWAALRTEMARVAGVVVFIGGAKLEGDILINAEGVRAELEAARKTGAFLVPIGSTGGMARAIAEELIGMTGAGGGGLSRRPSKRDLRSLMQREDPRVVAQRVISLLAGYAQGS